ncbi:MAG: hypothetical protein Q9174_002332 [Haloplaca sp. 1 TL-2023]
MTSVPLHCNICPKQPDFSDISHLLTHIGSKGHLSHYFKAQVRGRQDASVRNQLDIYDQWYTENQIEKLLSQRMILKDSKRANGVRRNTTQQDRASSKPPKATRTTRKKQIQSSKQRHESSAESQNVIDPQLSFSSGIPERSIGLRQSSATFFPPEQDPASLPHRQMPRMGTFRTPSSKPALSTDHNQRPRTTSTEGSITPDLVDGADTEADDDGNDRPLSPDLVYPEPPTNEEVLSLAEQPSNSTSARGSTRGRPKRGQCHNEDSKEVEEASMMRTPELKGVYYPGMSLFDSASPEAQRKRNQRKGGSMIAQIEQESREIECNEYIYWPDGSLKMCRFITGDAQTSPLKEDTPQSPAPPKRGRGRKPKAPVPGNNRGKSRKGVTPQSAGGGQADQWGPDPFNIEIPDPFEGPSDPWSMNRSSMGVQTHEEGSGWLLNTGEPSLERRRTLPETSKAEVSSSSRFGDAQWKSLTSPAPVFGLDDRQSREREDINSLISGEKVFHQRLQSGSASIVTTSQELRSQSQPQLKPTTQSYKPHVSVAMQDKENMAPYEAHNEQNVSRMPHGLPEPTQWFFTSSMDNGHHLSNTLPSEMAFGGMATPPVYRMSLNPLNPNAHLRRSLPYSSNYASFR